LSENTLLPYGALHLLLPDEHGIVVKLNNSGPGVVHVGNKDYIFSNDNGAIKTQIQNQ